MREVLKHVETNHQIQTCFGQVCQSLAIVALAQGGAAVALGKLLLRGAEFHSGGLGKTEALQGLH